MADLLVVDTQKKLINSVERYYKNGKNILQTGNKFKIDRKQVRNGIAEQGNIWKQKRQKQKCTE